MLRETIFGASPLWRLFESVPHIVAVLYISTLQTGEVWKSSEVLRKTEMDLKIGSSYVIFEIRLLFLPQIAGFNFTAI